MERVPPLFARIASLDIECRESASSGDGDARRVGASAATFCCTPRTPSAAHDLNERPASSPRRSIADSRHSLCVLRVVRPRSQLLLRSLNMISQTAARRASRRLLAQAAFEDTCRAAHRSRRSPDSPLYWNVTGMRLFRPRAHRGIRCGEASLHACECRDTLAERV